MALIDIQQPQSAPKRKFPVLNLGFRPFFIGAALFSVLSMLAWMGMYVFGWNWQPALPAMSWHSHEMVFGYGMAVIAGFLLAAV